MSATTGVFHAGLICLIVPHRASKCHSASLLHEHGIIDRLQSHCWKQPRLTYHGVRVEASCSLRVERVRRFVERRIRLPDSADTSRITASYDNGKDI